ncbi:deoxynucleotidyltransferase terminal-interacting protein 2-like [Dendropsophus ebraccatus]|uniref:deoxynucleotidyltransferase terminal-interacting protein 2-like n=1 Tax=Dendropsophus ebraccatus TaxID=150705 RepID=UPI0038312ECE
MVATRRGTCVEPSKEGDGRGQTEDVVSPPSPRQTRSSGRKDVQTSVNSADEGKSVAQSRSPLKYDALKLSPPITTRSRHRSEQSDANVSEAESCASNTSARRSRSRQSLGQVIDSTRKLRSRGSALITESISESKEDAEISEAESNFSSVSTTARKMDTRTSSRSVSTRSQKSILPSERPSDVSDAETNSSVSGVKTIATRSTRNSRARRQPSLVSESQKEQTSDAESCSSEFSRKPLARRLSRKNKSNLQTGEMESANETDKDDGQETVKKQSPKIHDVKSDAKSSVQEQNVLSSPRRSLRNQPAIHKKEVILISDEEPESGDKDLDTEQPEVEENSVETKAVPSLQSSETQPGENIIPEQILQLSENSMDAEPAVGKSHTLKASDAAKETNENPQNVQESSDIPENTDICLFIDSDGSEKSEHSDDDHIEDENMEVEEDNEVVQKENSKKASTQQLQDVVEDGLFVIDKAPVVDSSKKFFLDADAEEEDDSAADIDRDEHDEDADAEHGDFVKKRKSKKASKKQLQDVAGDGLFVIDTTPGVDSRKKYFLEPETVRNKEDANEADERGEVTELEGEGEGDDDDDDDFIDEDEDDKDEEEALLNRPKKGLELSTSIDTGINLKKMGGLYISFDAEKPKPGPSLLSKMKKGIKKQDELLRKSVITPDFEKKESVPPIKESRYKLKKLRKMEREKNTGRGWFDMKAPELTDELKSDLKALKMRSAMDPKHFYKKNDREGFPKYFEVGTVVDSPIDFYHSRIPKKQRKRTIVEELLVDSEFRRYNKKKYKEIMEEKTARAAGKKNRKKKKFRT